MALALLLVVYHLHLYLVYDDYFHCLFHNRYWTYYANCDCQETKHNAAGMKLWYCDGKDVLCEGAFVAADVVDFDDYSSDLYDSLNNADDFADMND